MDRHKISVLAKTCTVEELTEAIKLKFANLGVQDDCSEPEVLVEDLDLRTQVKRCLKRYGIRTLSDLARRTPDELLAMRGFGRYALGEVTRALVIRGKTLTQDTRHRNGPYGSKL